MNRTIVWSGAAAAALAGIGALTVAHGRRHVERPPAMPDGTIEIHERLPDGSQSITDGSFEPAPDVPLN